MWTKLDKLSPGDARPGSGPLTAAAHKGSELHKSGQDMPFVALTAEATGDKRQATGRPAGQQASRDR